MGTSPLIEITGLTVRYGSFCALDNLSLEIHGGTIGLLGPNGAWKSTLIRTLLGYNRAASGTVKVFGYELPKSVIAVRQRIGYMPEREVNSPKISAVNFLNYLGRLAGMRQVDAMERSHEALNYVGLGEARYRKMETYSTGMLQRVKLAQAIIHDPKLLLLDEPTNGLDPRGRLEILDLIREIAAERKVSLLLSSHLLPDVQHVCDRVIVLHQSKMVDDMDMAALTAPRSGYYELRVRDDHDGYAAALEEQGVSCSHHREDLIHVRLEETQSPRLLFELAVARQTQVRHLEPLRGDLAEAFMKSISGS